MTHLLRFCIAALVCCATVSIASAEIVQQWNFNDPAGTTFSTNTPWVNSGTVGDARFGGNGVASTDHETDGNGALCVKGDNDSNRFVNTNNTMTPITSGLVELSFRYDSLDFSATAAEHIAGGATGNMHLFGNLGFGFTSGGNVIDQFRLQLTQNTSGGVNNPAITFQHRAVALGNDVDNLLNTGVTTLTGPFDVRVTVDLDNGGTMNIFLNDGSGEVQFFDLETGTDQVYGASSIDGIQFFNQQTSNGQGDQMLGTDSGKIDFLQISVSVPEPSTIVMFCAGAFAGLARRRRR